MAVLQQAHLESALARALALAHALLARGAHQAPHGALCPQALELRPDGSMHLAPPPAQRQPLTLEQLRYASPEQAGQRLPIDLRSDLYSLGLMLYEWLLDQPAFDSSDALFLAYQQMFVSAEAPHALNPGVPPQVSELVMRLLAKAPGARYASVQALADDLQRCLQELRTSGQITRFALGSTDLRSQLTIPDQLYGRANEMATLVRAWQQAGWGQLQLCLVHGAAGMGKTALVRALRDTVQATGGVLLEGRFGAQQREFPYPALVEAFKALLRQILVGPQAQRLQWRKRLQGSNATSLAVVQEVLPELEWITGRLPRPPLLVGLAAQQRMHGAFMDLLTLFARAEHPMLLFLDDLQWADAATLGFVRAVLRERGHSHLLLVGAYRDGALGSTHALAQLRAELRREALSLSDIRLAALSLDEVAALIDDTCSHINNLPALAQQVMREALGNPQATRHCLQALVAQGQLHYDPAARAWRWSASAGVAAAPSLWWV